MRIGEVARRTGLTVHTLRFYERKGLLPRAVRGTSNYRDFPPTSIERLTFIREAQRLGFTLSEVREFVDARNTPMGCAELRSKGERKLLEVEAELRRLRTIRASLRKLPRGAAVRVGYRRACPDRLDHGPRIPRSSARQPFGPTEHVAWLSELTLSALTTVKPRNRGPRVGTLAPRCRSLADELLERPAEGRF